MVEDYQDDQEQSMDWYNGRYFVLGEMVHPETSKYLLDNNCQITFKLMGQDPEKGSKIFRVIVRKFVKKGDTVMSRDLFISDKMVVSEYRDFLNALDEFVCFMDLNIERGNTDLDTSFSLAKHLQEQNSEVEDNE